MTSTKVFSVRVAEELFRKLEADASNAKRSLSEHAREVLAKSVERTEAPVESSPEVAEVMSQIKQLRSQVSNSIEAILVATRALTPDEAHELISKHFT